MKENDFGSLPYKKFRPSNFKNGPNFFNFILKIKIWFGPSNYKDDPNHQAAECRCAWQGGHAPHCLPATPFFLPVTAAARLGRDRLDLVVLRLNLVRGRPDPACRDQIWPAAARSGLDKKKKKTCAVNAAARSPSISSSTGGWVGRTTGSRGSKAEERLQRGRQRP